jgi:hypothetical protein
VHDPATVSAALAGCQAAYYLVHLLGDADFSATTPSAAEVAARAGLTRIGGYGGISSELGETAR